MSTLRFVTLAIAGFFGVFCLGSVLLPSAPVQSAATPEEYCNAAVKSENLAKINQLKQKLARNEVALDTRAKVQPLLDKFDAEYQRCLRVRASEQVSRSNTPPDQANRNEPYSHHSSYNYSTNGYAGAESTVNNALNDWISACREAGGTADLSIIKCRY
jgi:hypothetical protein